MSTLAVSKRQVRRVLLAASGLLAWQAPDQGTERGVPWREVHQGLSGVAEVIRRLGAVQLDPVATVARNHHLVLWNRVGGYRPELLEALYRERRIFEYWAQARCLLPIEAYPALMDGHGRQRPVEDEHLVEAMALIRSRLAEEGPLPARALDSGGRVASAWGGTQKATSKALEMLWDRGEVVVAFRQKEERYFALADRWLPPEVRSRDSVDPTERIRRYIRAYGVVDPGDPRFGWMGWHGLRASERRKLAEQLAAEGVLVPLEIEGVKRKYYIQAELVPQLDRLDTVEVLPEVFLLPPLDNLLWRRERIQDLFDFDYRWEIYTPKAKRRFGPYAMPVLEGEHFVALVNARLDPGARALVADPIFWRTPPTGAQKDRVEAALSRLAGYLDAGLQVISHVELE